MTKANALNNVFDAGALTGTLDPARLDVSGVTAASYTNPTLTIDNKGRITSASDGTGLLPTTVVTGTTQAIAINNTYVPNNASLCTLTLPAVAAVGSIVEIVGLGAGGWLIAQNASQLVHFGTATSTTGVGGSIASVNRYDAIKLKCVVANNEWVVVSSQGNMTVT